MMMLLKMFIFFYLKWIGLAWIPMVADGQDIESAINGVILSYDNEPFGDTVDLFSDQTSEAHRRRVKRQIQNTPINMTFQLEKLGTWASDSNIKVGHKIPFQLTIWLDETGSTDLNIEIITQTVTDDSTNTDWAVLSLCTPEITSTGVNFGGFTPAEIVPIMSATAGDGRYNSAAISFGTVVGTNIGVDRDKDKLILVFDVTVNNHSAAMGGESFWVSAGAQYNDRENVWISQAVFTVQATTEAELSSGSSRSYVISGPSTVMKGATGVWTLNLILTDAVTDILVEVYAPDDGNQVMSMCRISIGDTGESYGCYARDDSPALSFPDIPGESPLPGTHTVAMFAISDIINTKYWDGDSNSADNNISLSIAATVLNVSDAVPGASHSLGLAVELDQSAVWAAEIDVEISHETFDSSNDLPDVVLWTTEAQLAWNTIATIYVNITLPPGATDNYLLELSLADAEDTNVFDIGDDPISVYHVGFNYPCWDPNGTVTTVESQFAGFPADYMALNMGIVSNSGERPASGDNTIVLRLQVPVVPSHGSVSSGESVDVTGGLQIGDNHIWIGILTFDIFDSLATRATRAPSLSIWNMMNHRDSGMLYEKGSTAYILKLELPAMSFWPNFTVSVSSPVVSDYPAIDICNVEVYQSGRDLVFGQQSSDNPYGMEISYTRFRQPQTKAFVTESYDLSILNFGNAGYGNFWWAANDSALYLTLTVRATENPALVNGSFYWLTVSVDYDADSSPITEDVALQYNTDQPELSEEDAVPSFSIVQTSASNSIRASGIAQFDVNILTTPRTLQEFSVEALALNDTLSVCRVALRQKGKNIPCFAGAEQYHTYFGEAENVTCAADSTSSKCLDSQQDHSIFTMGKVANIGQTALTNSTYADNEFSVEVAVKIHENYQDTISQGDSYTVVLGIFQGGNTLSIEDVTVTADTSALPTLAILPELQWYNFKNSSELTLGGASVYVLDMYIPPGSMDTYRLEFFSPINSTQNGGKATICDARIMSANWHLPCVNDSYVYHERLSLDNGTTYDAAIIDLGVVTNAAADDGTYPVNATENMLRVEVAMCVPTGSEAVPSDYLWLAATLKINEDYIYVSSLPLEVIADVPVTESENDTLLEMQNITHDTDWVFIGERKPFAINIITQMMMSRLTLNFKFPDDSAGETLLNLVDAHVSFAGTNIACGENLMPNVTISNTITTPSTSQDEDLEVDLGVVTNVGTTTRYDFGNYHYTDDMITLSFDIVASDNAQNTDMYDPLYNVVLKSEQGFDIVMTDTEGRTDTVSGSVTIARDSGTEVPDLQIAEVYMADDIAATDINQGDTVTVYVNFNHTWESRAHGHNIVLRVYVPDLLTYVSTGGFKYMSPGVDFSAKRVLSISVTELFFSDNETFHIDFTFDSANTLPVGSGLVHLVLPCDITYNSEGGGAYFTDVYMFELDAFVPDCHDSLGLESTIQSCQIVSSVTEGFDPDMVRFNSQGGWQTSGVRAEPFLLHEYLQINFGSMKRITGFKIQPFFNDVNFVTTLRLQYSYEGLKWFDYLDPDTNAFKVFNILTEVANISAVSEVHVKLNSTYEDAIEARYVRVIPLTSLNGSSELSLRLELYGCAIVDTAVQTACPVDSRKPIYERGYLLDESKGTLYVCMLSNIDDYIKCSYTEDDGESWEEISNDVINIHFIMRDTSTLYGLARNQLSRMRSDDGGDNWWVVTEDEYSQAEADSSNVILVKSLPFNNWPLNLEDLYTEFGLYFNLTVKWTADMDGLHVWPSTSGNWAMVGYWYHH